MTSVYCAEFATFEVILSQHVRTFSHASRHSFSSVISLAFVVHSGGRFAGILLPCSSTFVAADDDEVIGDVSSETHQISGLVWAN
jgi:hypothetical protein